MSVTASSLWPLLLLLAVPVVVRWGRHTATGLSPLHLKVSTVLRVLVLLLLTLALTKPVLHRRARAVSVVYVLDVSRSIASPFIEKSLEWIRRANREYAPDHDAYVAFADRPIVLGNADAIRTISVTTGGASGPSVVDQSQTNLSLALVESLRNFAPDHRKRLVLFSDGNSTEGDLGLAVGRARSQGARIFTIPADVRAPGDAWIEAVDLPDDVRAEEPVETEVVVVAREKTRGVIEIAPLGGRAEVVLTRGVNRVPVSVRFPRSGLQRVEASVRVEGDPFPDNDLYPTSVRVQDRPRVLYVEGHAESAPYLEGALARSGIDVTVFGSLPESEAELSKYDAVILSDLPYRSLTPAAQQVLARYVRDEGGGLLFAGGETSYGESGYAGSVVEDVLPVRFQIKEPKKDLALIIILDKSYSMLGAKLDLAKEATIAALDLLKDTQRFGVVTFNWDPYVSVPLQVVGTKTAIREEVSRIQASGQTNIFPALRSAFMQLSETEAKVKHVILLSDGKTYPNEFETLLGRMVSSEMTVSTVAVGEEADRELLTNIAKWGKGRSYYLQDARRVPQIFIEETQLAVQDTLEEKPFRPVVLEGVEALRGVDFGTAPLLKGHVSTQAKETAEIILEAAPEVPLLARWQYGLGKAVVFTSDVKNRWAVDWLAWPGYGKFWAQLVRETVRRRPREDRDLRIHRKGGTATVNLTAVTREGLNENDLTPVASVSFGSGAPRAVPLAQVAPGAYRADVALKPGAEPYRFDVSVPGARLDPVDAFFPYPDEYRFLPPNVKLLRALSEETGGVYDAQPPDVFRDYSDAATVPTPLWSWLLGAALLVYLADVAVRRAPWFWARLSHVPVQSTS